MPGSSTPRRRLQDRFGARPQARKTPPWALQLWRGGFRTGRVGNAFADLGTPPLLPFGFYATSFPMTRYF